MMPRMPISGPSVWTGAEIAVSDRWQRRLGPEALAEIDAAVAAARRHGRDWQTVTAAEFPLPSTAALLADIAHELEWGCGMVRLQGFPVGRYDLDTLRLAYAGVAGHLGRPVFQNRHGQRMRDIRDEARDGVDLGRRYGQIAGGTPFLSSYARTLSNGALRFHTDRTDVVGLLCVRQARAGGISRVCSSAAVHNAILADRPDLAEALFQAMPRSRLGEETDDPANLYWLPVFGLAEGRLTSHFSLTYIEAAERAPGSQPLTPVQRAAVDRLMADADALAFDMTLAPGDLQLLNSHATYHARTAFDDDPLSGQDRLLLRLWLTVPNSRPLPPDHAVLWGSTAAGAPRGGIGQATGPG